MPCGCLGKKVIYNSLTNISLPSQNTNANILKESPVVKPRIRNNWQRVQQDLKRSK